MEGSEGSRMFWTVAIFLLVAAPICLLGFNREREAEINRSAPFYHRDSQGRPWHDEGLADHYDGGTGRVRLTWDEAAKEWLDN